MAYRWLPVYEDGDPYPTRLELYEGPDEPPRGEPDAERVMPALRAWLERTRTSTPVRLTK